MFHLGYFFFDRIIMHMDELQESIDEWFKEVPSNFSKLYFFVILTLKFQSIVGGGF
jgi:hypothetical protein